MSTATTTLNHAGLTGDVTFHFTSATHAYVTTEGAHVNDDTPAVTYRGRRLLVSADVLWHTDVDVVDVDTRTHGCWFAPVDNLGKARNCTESERLAIANAIRATLTSHDFATERHAAESARLSNAWTAASKAVQDAQQALTAATERHAAACAALDAHASKGA